MEQKEKSYDYVKFESRRHPYRNAKGVKKNEKDTWQSR